MSQVRPPLVVVIDDYDDVRDMLVAFLQSRGFAAKGFRDGAAARTTLATLAPDALVVEPLTDGALDAVTRARLRDDGLRVPALAITRAARDEVARNAMDAGCTRTLTKPVAPEVLESELRRLLAATASRRTA